jgi:hypothetical protein
MREWNGYAREVLDRGSRRLLLGFCAKFRHDAQLDPVCKLPSKRTLLCCMVVLACQRTAGRHSTSTGPGPTVTSNHVALASGTETRQTGASLHQPPPTLATDATWGAASSNVVISSVPACAQGADPADKAAPADQPSFLADPTMQQRVEVLANELKAFGGLQLGTYSDANERAAVVVFPQEFTDYLALQARLAPRVTPLRVILRPSCYPHVKLDEAQRVIAELQWHPRAKSVPIVWHFDPSFSGYTVTVHDSAPGVAAALSQRLGPLVQVRLGKPRPAAIGEPR